MRPTKGRTILTLDAGDTRLFLTADTTIAAACYTTITTTTRRPFYDPTRLKSSTMEFIVHDATRPLSCASYIS